MHITTEVDHPQHVCEVQGVGLTETVNDVVEALCRLNYQASTKDITNTAGLRDRQEARRELRRLEDAGVVISKEIDVDLRGTARKPYEWTVTQEALDTRIVERLRAGSDVPLDPVREREQRIADLENTVTELRTEVEHLRDELDGIREDKETPAKDGWEGLNPVDSHTSTEDKNDNRW